MSARSVVSVRFSDSEFEQIERAAEELGIPASTYVRNAALTTTGIIDFDALHRALVAIHNSQRILREANTSLRSLTYLRLLD